MSPSGLKIGNVGDLEALNEGELGSCETEVRRKDADRILDWRLRDDWRLCGVDGVLAGSAASSAGTASGLAGTSGGILGDVGLPSPGEASASGPEGSVGAPLCSDAPVGSSFSSEDPSFFFATPAFLVFSFCLFSCSNYVID